MGSSEEVGDNDEATTGMRQAGECQEKGRMAMGCPLWTGRITTALDLSLSLCWRQLPILMAKEMRGSKPEGSSRGANWSFMGSASPWTKVLNKE